MLYVSKVNDALFFYICLTVLKINKLVILTKRPYSLNNPDLLHIFVRNII